MNATKQSPGESRGQENSAESRPKTYTTWGSVRGPCGHRHRTVTTAQACIDRDHAGARSQGGYSDRCVHEYDCATVDSCGTGPCKCDIDYPEEE